MFDVARNSIRSITELGIALLALAIIATLLVGPANMAFLGAVFMMTSAKKGGLRTLESCYSCPFEGTASGVHLFSTPWCRKRHRRQAFLPSVSTQVIVDLRRKFRL